MASSLNKVMLIGNLGKDAELRHTPNGVPVTNFSLATTHRQKDPNTGDWNERTEWHDVVLWRAERVSVYLKKGKKVFVEGRLQTRSWEDQQGQKRYRTEVVCDSFGLMLLGGRDEGSGYGGGYSGSGRGSGYSPSRRGGENRGGAGGFEGGGRPAPAPSPSGSGGESSGGGSSSTYDDDDIPF